MNNKIKIFLNWLAVALWLLLIYYFSSQPNLGSGLPFWWDMLFRKAAHVSEYFVLTYLFFKAFRLHRLGYKNNLLLSSVLTIIVAALDEWHQAYVVGRLGSVFDVAVDSLGVAVILILFHLNRRSYFYEDLSSK